MTENRFDRYLAETDWLERTLGEPDLRIFDCTVHLVPEPPASYGVRSGRADYDRGHVPGAGFLDLPGELSDLQSALRFMLPSSEQFSRVMSEKGIGPDSRVVLYSTTTVQWATRIWWMLRAFGFDNARVLNGGFPKWRAEGRPVSVAPCTYPADRFEPHPRPGLFVGKAEVLAALGEPNTRVLNALSEQHHDGTSPLNYGRPGRIAGSGCVPAASLIDEARGTYLDPAALQKKLDEADATRDKRVLTYCGGGIAASSTAFVLTLLGYDSVAVYDASLSEWAADDVLPMQTG